MVSEFSCVLRSPPSTGDQEQPAVVAVAAHIDRGHDLTVKMLAGRRDRRESPRSIRKQGGPADGTTQVRHLRDVLPAAVHLALPLWIRTPDLERAGIVVGP